MQRIPLPLESYQHTSPSLSAKRLVNMYAEQAPHDARSAAALVSTPGLRADMTVGAGPVWALNGDMGNPTYAVSGTHFYRIVFFPALDIQDLGDIGTPARAGDFYSIAVGSLAAVVCSPPNAFTCMHETGGLNQIGGDFSGAGSVAHLDGYFVFTGPGSDTRFFVSRILDATAYDALDFAYADAVPNTIRRVVTHRGQLWMIGENAHEVWYDSGDADFPFRRMPGAVIPIGCGNARSVARADGSVWWVGRDDCIYRTDGYRADRVSTHAIESIVQLHGNMSATNALAYTDNGHTFYAVTFGLRTLVYDCATKVWHERSSSTDGLAAWRPASADIFAGTHWFGDSLSGKLFIQPAITATEDGVAVIRQATLPPLWAGTGRGFCSRLEVEMEVGTAFSNADMAIAWSDDGGLTWGAPRAMSTGPIGATRRRVYTTRLGSFRQRVFRLTMTGRPTVYAVDAAIQAGG